MHSPDLRNCLSAARLASLAALFSILTNCGADNACPSPSPPAGHVIAIDIDDHGLAGLWMANAPNLRNLIANGTLAYSRVVVPTHSNQNNIALLSGQFPDGDSVPANSWLSRSKNFAAPFAVQGLELGDYATYTANPLRVRGDSVYQAVHRANGTSAYFGDLPALELGADVVHLTMTGLQFGALTASPELVRALMEQVLGYPHALLERYAIDGPPAPGESFTHFALQDAASFVRATSAATPMPSYMFLWGFLALDGSPTDASGASGPALVAAVEDYDAALGELLAALGEKGLLADTNIVFTLDHGKVDSDKQVVLGTRGGADPTKPADGQLAAAVTAMGPALGISTADYALLNEDGDAQIYANVPGAGTPAGAARQAEVTHALLAVIQSGAIAGLDTFHTMTADGAMGTLRFQDFHASGPNQADILVFPQDGWTLNQVDSTNTAPGPFVQHTAFPYGRHGGFSPDELYVPLILSGPAFKKGALVPHPIEHPQVPVTALATLGGVRLATAARGPILAALANDAAETIPQPALSAATRDLVLAASGYAGEPALGGPPAQAAVIIDAGGLYEEEIFNDGRLGDAASPLRALADRGVCFEDFWTDSRDEAVTAYQFLAGGLPTFSSLDVAPAESDPTQKVPPAIGLLQMPVPARFIANRAGYDGWRKPVAFPGGSLFSAAQWLGMTTALVDLSKLYALHIEPASIDLKIEATEATLTEALQEILAAHPRSLTVVALGGARTGDRHAAAAATELAALGAQVAALVDAATAAGAVVFVTSRGASAIDDPKADFYGAGSSRHVPLLVLGPNVRVGVISGQPAGPGDLAATVLFALGAPTATDFVLGTRAATPLLGGPGVPLPAAATAGHALVRGFSLATHATSATR